MCTIQLTINCYNLIWYEELQENTTALVTCILWTIAAACQIIFICVGGALINAKAHKPLEYIYDISVDETSQQDSVKLQMFLSKLNGQPIGLTAFGMFVIDKPTILTIIGLLLTYFVIIVQFSPAYIGGSATESICNCTSYFRNTTMECFVNG